jgi:hypothetical protein
LLTPILTSFFVRPKEPFLRPDLRSQMTPRAGAVKDGRRSGGASGSALDRPRLDGTEHGVILAAVGITFFYLAANHAI